MSPLLPHRLRGVDGVDQFTETAEVFALWGEDEAGHLGELRFFVLFGEGDALHEMMAVEHA